MKYSVDAGYRKSLPLVSFHCRFIPKDDESGKGFKIEYNVIEKFTDCGGNYSYTSGILNSPLHPDPYPGMATCIYLISQPNGTYVNISFLNMDIVCQDLALGSDYIEMRDGISEDSPLMGKFCGNGSDVPTFMQTTQSSLMIR